jgi:hypothetical protein
MTQAIETTNKTARTNGISGIKVGKIDGERMRRYIDVAGIKLDAGDTNEQLALALQEHFKKTVPAADQVRCDQCTGISNAEEESCPFCGDAGDVEEDQAEEIETTHAVAVPVEESSVEIEDDGTDEGPTLGVEEDVVAAPATPKKTTAKKKAKETTMPTTEATSAKTNGHAKKGKAAPATTESKALAKVAPAGALAPAGTLTAADLDVAVADITRLKGSAAEGYWLLGRRLLEINKQQLWKQRLDENGKVKYKGWDTFVHAELKMSPQNSYHMMEVAAEYKTAEEVQALGHTKATLLLKAAPEDREALKAKAKAGASHRALQKDVAASREKHGNPKQGSKGTKGGAASLKKVTTAKATAASEKVSIASFEGTRTIKLFKRPETLKDLDLSKCKRAKSIGDQPFGRLEMANGLVQNFSVINKDGEWVLKIETRREEA